MNKLDLDGVILTEADGVMDRRNRLYLVSDIVRPGAVRQRTEECGVVWLRLKRLPKCFRENIGCPKNPTFSENVSCEK